MTEKVAIDSLGNAVVLNSEQMLPTILNPEIKLEELKNTRDYIVKLLTSANFNLKSNNCIYMLQPNYIYEKILFITKVPISASSKAVKIANELNTHTEILSDEKSYNFYRSIISDHTVKYPCWYYLSVTGIEFERNLYDCKRISVRLLQPTPFEGLIKEINRLVPSLDNNSSMQYDIILNGIDVSDVQSVISIAQDDDIDKTDNTSIFSKNIAQALNHYCASLDFSKRDSLSNKANLCLTIASNKRINIYSLYIKIKNCIKKTLNDVYGVVYTDNKITAHIGNNNVLVLYVSGTEEKPEILINGTILHTIDELRQFLLLERYLDIPEWYANKVIPYI